MGFARVTFVQVTATRPSPPKTTVPIIDQYLARRPVTQYAALATEIIQKYSFGSAWVQGNVGETTDGWLINHRANEGIDTSRGFLEGVWPYAEDIRRSFIC